MSEQKTEDRKIYKWRPMRGMKADNPAWAQLGEGLRLSELLNLHVISGDTRARLFLCGSLAQMTREYVEEPLNRGWTFARPYIHKFRSPVYKRMVDGAEVEISVKLVGESWLPGCEDMNIGIVAWAALTREWAAKTGIPLLSTPTKTGQALLHESFPDGEFPSLPDGLAQLIRGISPQHRLQMFATLESVADVALAQVGDVSVGVPLYAVDGRWMYAGAALTDRLPIGEARKVGDFRQFQPGWHHVKIRVPKSWAHIGLIPRPCEVGGDRAWDYPNKPGEIIQAWVSEPELTLALSHGWEPMFHIDGYEFDKGRPLARWAKKLIGMRESLQHSARWAKDGAGPLATNHYDYAAAACREILNHTIGSFHVNTYEREAVVKADEHKELVAEWGYEKVRTLEKLRGGKRRVVYPERHSDKLSIYMPHWSAQIWALERAWMAKHALQVDPAALVEIRGDAIYSTQPLPFDAGENANYSQLRVKEVD